LVLIMQQLDAITEMETVHAFGDPELGVRAESVVKRQ
jgi:hypothetical protein